MCRAKPIKRDAGSRLALPRQEGLALKQARSPWADVVYET